MSSLDFTLLLSPDNASRKAAEATFDAARQSHPQVVAAQLITTLNMPGDPATQELCAVLARRYLPAMFDLTYLVFTEETRESVKTGLLSALSADHAPSLRRKLCSTVGRLGAELLASNGWPQLNDFMQHACGSGNPTLHEAAISVLGHMAPALVDVESWQKCGGGVQAILLDGLTAGRATEVQTAALSALASMLMKSALNERDAEERLLSAPDERGRKAAKTVRKAHKAIAASLGEALPPMLSVLESALQNNPSGAGLLALENLAEVAEAQPRLFKPVLAQVVEGMSALALSPLDRDVRIAAAEMLVALCEALPSMCQKLPGFVERVLSTLLAFAVRLDDDTAEWDEAEPADGLNADDEAEGDKEAAYALEALDRVCAAVEGRGVVPLLLPQVEALVGGGAWQQRHAALIALAQVCDHCGPKLLPHLGSLVQLVASCAAAAEARVRWAAMYCLGLLADQFEQLPNEHHAAVMPLVLQGIGDASLRVQAAASLTVINLCSQMDTEALAHYQQGLLGALHARLAAAPPAYVAFAAASGLSQVFSSLGDSVAPTYATFMPMLRARFEAAVNAKTYPLASVVLGAMGSLAAAGGAACFAADAEAVVAPLVNLLLQHRSMLAEVNLEEPMHASLAKMAGPMGAAFQPHMAQLLPLLLEAAGVVVETTVEEVEEVKEDDEDANIESHYVQLKTGGYTRVCCNVAQMQEKVLGVGALFEYAQALGSSFAPFVQPAVEAALSLLGYNFSLHVRQQAAFVLSECIKCVSTAGSKGEAGVAAADGAALVGSLLKPLGEALHKEKELEPADALLSVFLEVLKAGRLTGETLLSPPQLSGVIELLKQQLHLDAKRREARAAAVDDEDDEAAADDEEQLELEWEILLTVCHCVRELLRQHGAEMALVMEAQLLPLVQGWQAADEPHQAAALFVMADLIEFGGPEGSKRFCQLALPHMLKGADGEGDKDTRLQSAAAAGLGIAAQFGGKLLSRGATADAARKLAAMAQAPDARCSEHSDRTENAVLGIGRLLVHRMADLERAGLAAELVPLWLASLPLRNAEEEAAQEILRCFCQLLGGEAAQAILGAEGANLPQVLTIMGATAGKEATGTELTNQMQQLVLSWQAANPALLQASASALSQPTLDTLGKMMGGTA